MIKHFIFLIFTLTFIAACDQRDGASEQTGEDVTEAVEAADDDVMADDVMADDVMDSAEGDAAEMSEGMDDMQDGAEDAMQAVEAAVGDVMADDVMDSAEGDATEMGEGMDDMQDGAEDAVQAVEAAAGDVMDSAEGK